MLLLFDIDGTLVSGAADAHRDALLAALVEVHGVHAPDAPIEISHAGRTDGEISRAILLGAGVSADRIDERVPTVREVCCRNYVKLCTEDLSHTVLPGVIELLDWLAANGDALLGLVTGNYEVIARRKLRQAGIGHYFPSGQGAFGSDSDDRTMLPAIARRRAGAVGAPYPRAKTLVIGDTPRDIACARADGLPCFAVSTGPFGPAELIEADAVVPDARALRSELEALLG